MGMVIANMSMSLDGFIADESDGVGPLFEWYEAGPVETPTAVKELTFHTDEASARDLRELLPGIGALVCGRRVFDITSGWGGHHPAGCPVFVVTHSIPDGWPREDAPFTFVLDGAESALAQAQAVAGDRTVAVATPSITQQLLDAGLLDAIRVDLAPVLLGRGIPFFANLKKAPVMLEDPEVTEGLRVTHLFYRVRRP